MNYPTISTKDTCDNLAEITEQVSVANKSFVITKFGKQKALISPIQVAKSRIGESQKQKSFIQTLKDSFRIWSYQASDDDSVTYVQKLRQPRYEVFD